MSSEFSQPVSERASTKIVATVGPACSSMEQLGQLIAAGVDVFRINTAHGDQTQHDGLLENIRAAAAKQDRPIATLVDLSGPKIRLGRLAEDPLVCSLNAQFSFVRGDNARAPHELTANYPRLVDELDEGDRVLLADGTVEMLVMEKERDRVLCKVVLPGVLRSRQGVNLPGVKLSVPSMTDRDRDAAIWAGKRNVDYVSLSFVRSAQDMHALRGLLEESGSQAWTISKIEKPEALAALDEIVLASDGIMVARGDLGVEIDIEETPFQQKRIIETCARYRRPVIVATQMLDSMQQASRPTRAEASDVANAILDGADACMLSGETAIGQYPRESVEMMNRIMLSTEALMQDRHFQRVKPDQEKARIRPVTEALVAGSGQIARRLDARLVAIKTKTGRTALAKAKQRDLIPTIAVSTSEETLRRMALFWGIEPLRGAPEDVEALGDFIGHWGKRHGAIAAGDLIVLMTSGEFGAAQNRVAVHQIR